MPTKAELQAQLDAHDADPATVSTALAMPVIAVGGLLTLSIVHLIAGRVSPSGAFSPLWLALPTVIGWVVVHFHAKSHYPPQIFGHAPRDVARGLATAGGLGATVWVVSTGYLGLAATWPYLFLGAGSVTAAWWGLLWWTGRIDRAAPVEVVSTDDAVAHDMPWSLILEQSDPRTVITGVEYHRAGARLTIEPARRVADDGTVIDEQVTFDDFAACATRFASNAAREYRRRTGERLPLNSTRPETGRDDAEFVLHVTMRDVFTEDTPYVAATEPDDIRTPKDLGEYEDATRILISLLSGHAKIVGMTGAGKTVEANNWIARITECANALVWICATDKLIPLIFPWLRSWFDGTSTQPCLDYVAGKHIDRVLGMLADAYKLCCDRNDRLTDESKMTATSREPAVFVFVEEVSHAAEFGNTIVTHDGQEVGLSDLLMMVARGGRSANVRIVLMAQTALNGALGDAAPEIIRNLAIRVCLRTMESHDGYRTIPALNNVDTTQIPLFTKIVQPSIEQARAMPGKAAALDGTKTIGEIAARQSEWRPRGGIEAETDLGPRYRHRWNRAVLPELAAAVEKAGLTWRVPAETTGTGPIVTPKPAPTTVEQAPPTEEGPTVDTTEWTEQDDAAVTDLLDGTSEPRRNVAFRLPDSARGLDRLKGLAAEIGEPGGDDAHGDDAVVAEAAPLPHPLDKVIAWLDAEEAAGATGTFVLTADIAAGIGYTDTAKLGRDIYRASKVNSRNALADEAPGKPKGYDVGLLREAASRIRFAL